MEILLNKIDKKLTLEGFDLISKFELGNPKFINPHSDIYYKLSLSLSLKEVLIKGELDVAINLLCSRCSEFFSTIVHVSDFLRAYSLSQGQEKLDITNDFQEEIILNIPAFPICSEKCVGICFRCGVNLNKSKCSCEKIKKLDHWSVLDQLDL